MTSAEAKAISLNSLQAGRKRAKEAVQRVVSYALENVATVPPRHDTERTITRFVTEALLNPGHESRFYPKLHKMFSRQVNEDFLQQCIDEGRIKIKC